MWQGEAVITMPMRLALSDGVQLCPYAGAPWSVTLAAAVLRERDLGLASPWAPYVRSLPAETVGFANSLEAPGSAGVPMPEEAVAREEAGVEKRDRLGARGGAGVGVNVPPPIYLGPLRGDLGAATEMARYTTLVAGSLTAMRMMGDTWSAAEWRWAMSQVHSRTFRVEEPAGNGNDGIACHTRRLLVPYVDLLNHDSREDAWQCEWGCEWDTGGG